MKLIFPNYLAAVLALGIGPMAAQNLPLHPGLAAAASKVDTAGSFFEVDLVKEDIDMLLPYAGPMGEFLQELDEDVPTVDVRGMLEASGLLDLSAVAKSNARHGDSWLNKTYYATGGSRKGLFSLMAGDSEAFRVARMAPSGTDLAAELRIALTQVPGLIRSVGGAMGVAGEVGEQLAKEVDHLGMTIEEALERTTLTVQLAMSFELGNEGEAGTLPMPKELVCRIDGMTWFWNKAGEAWLEESRSAGLLDMTRSETDGVVTYAITSEGFTEPGTPAVIVVEAASDTIWLASSAESLANAQTGGSRLADDPAFQATWAGMPQSGNAMVYVSPRLFRASVRSALPLLGELAGPLDESGESTGAIDRLLAKLAADLAAPDCGLGFSASNDEGGLLTVSRLPFPGKYLDDLFLGDLLYEFLADPELLALMTMDDEELDGLVDQAIKDGTFSPEEVEALIEESRKEARETIQGMGLDEETTTRILDNMEEEMRKELRQPHKAGQQGGAGE